MSLKVAVGAHGPEAYRKREKSEAKYFDFSISYGHLIYLFSFFLQIPSHDLDTITTVRPKGFANGAKKYDLCNHSSQPNAMEVENLSKTYDGHNQALRNVTFNVKSGEVRLIFYSSSRNGTEKI